MRNNGILDSYFAEFIAASEMTDKVRVFNVFGQNPDVGTATIEDVWEIGGRYTLFDTASQLTLVSDNAMDAPGQGGLEFVTLTGCDSDYNYMEVKYPLNGLTPVNTIDTWLRVFRMRGGSSVITDKDVKAAGAITAKAGATQAAISPGSATSKQAFITILKGYTGFTKLAYTSGGASDDFIMRFLSRQPGGVFTESNDIEITNSSFASVLFSPPPGGAPEMTDIKVEAQANAQNAQVRINYVTVMVKNDFLQSLADSV